MRRRALTEYLARDDAGPSLPERWQHPLAGIRFGEELLEPARALATRSGVRLIPLWMPDDAGVDIEIERIGE